MAKFVQLVIVEDTAVHLCYPGHLVHTWARPSRLFLGLIFSPQYYATVESLDRLSGYLADC